MVGIETEPAAGAPPDERLPEEAPPPRAALGRLPLLLAALAGVVLVVGTIGPPLFGRGVFLGTNTLSQAYPWHATMDTSNSADHGPIGDTIDGVYPYRKLFADAVRHGNFLAWNPFVAGGTTLGADGLAATVSPVELVYVVLPGWYASAAVKLVVMVAAGGFTYLFCRRLGTGKVAAVFGGMAFAGSGFMVMWTGWPHPEVAACIPAVFWATERFLQRPSARTAVPIALGLAVMLLGNFPALVFHTLYVLGPYVLVRLAFEHRDRLRRALAPLAGASAALVGGSLLVAVVLLPFAARLSFVGSIDTRHQNPAKTLGLDTLLTSVAPKALGLSTEPPSAEWFGRYNQIESVSFIGITAALLAVLAVALPRLRSTPRGARAVLAVATAVLGWATFVGGDVLGLLQHLPGFEESFIGRARAILGFMVAVLAALGLQAVVERSWPARRRQWIRAGAVLAAAGLALAYAADRALVRARGFGKVGVLKEGLLLPALVGLAVLVALAAVRWGGRRVAATGLAAVPLLLVVESLALSVPLLPNEPRSTFYPRTPGLDFLAAHAGDDRVAPQDLTLFASAAGLYDLHVVGGHAFASPTWKQAVRRVDPAAYSRSPTLPFLAGSEAVAASPLLDRLNARWFAATPGTLALGDRATSAVSQATCATTTPLGDGHAVTATVPAGPGLRGLVLRLCAPASLPRGAAVEATAPGQAVPSRLPVGPPVAAGELHVVVPVGRPAAGGDVTVRLALTGAGDRTLALATTRGGRGGVVVADAVHAADDGLRVVYVDDMVVYQRQRALPRVRWAGRAEVETDSARRLDRLAGGDLPDGTVVLSQAGPAGSGAAGTVRVIRNTPTSQAVRVTADGDGYVVVADALQQGWVATVDGRRADLVAADHAGVAVHVPAGRHDVGLRYEPPGQRLGVVISVLALLALVVAWFWGDRLLARFSARRRSTSDRRAT